MYADRKKINGSVVSWVWLWERDIEREREMTKGPKKAFGSDEYVYYLYCDDGYRYITPCKKPFTVC